jgi:hypothetical protein
MRHFGRVKFAITAAACAAVGAVAGIAGAAASTPSTKAPAPAPPPAGRVWPRGHRFGPGAIGLGPVVHAQVVVLNKAGTGFITATIDQGTVKSVSGDQLTIIEGIGKVTYKTVALTVPAGATISRNLRVAPLTALKAGDRVRVEQSSEGTAVSALSSDFRPAHVLRRFGPPGSGANGRILTPPYGPPGGVPGPVSP